MLTNYRSGAGRQPLILTSRKLGTPEANALQSAGAEILPLPDLSWPTILAALHSTAHIARLMVEGGARVIESALNAGDEGGVVDDLIITVSPRFAGSNGTRYASQPSDAAWQVHRKAWFGDDAVWWWQSRQQ